MLTRLQRRGLTGFGLAALAAILTPGAMGRAQTAKSPDEPTRIDGTIVSIRGDILVVRPSLRHKMTRLSFGANTTIMGFAQATPAILKPGARIMAVGPYSEQGGFHPRWIEAAEKPIGYLAAKSDGLKMDENGRARCIGTLKSVSPFVVVADNGKEMPGKLDRMRGVWRVYSEDRNALLIGVRIEAEGKVAPDGVIQAATISPDRNFAKAGAMFGKILAVQGGTVILQPRYTDDKLTVKMAEGCILQRQVTLDPDSVKTGDAITFWAQQRPDDPTHAGDLKAIALLVGKERYPAADSANTVFATGKLLALEPDVKLQRTDGKIFKIIIPAQMPVVNLQTIPLAALKPGTEAMFVLSRNPNGGFKTSAIVLDASPWVGYGG